MIYHNLTQIKFTSKNRGLKQLLYIVLGEKVEREKRKLIR